MRRPFAAMQSAALTLVQRVELRRYQIVRSGRAGPGHPGKGQSQLLTCVF
jgi:hypothetical protein